MNNNLKIALLGTSNSVLSSGYKTYLKKSNYLIDSYGIGDVSTIYGIYQIITNDIVNKYDFCLIDYCINEFIFLQNNILTYERVYFYILGIISLFKEKKCIPFFLLLSPKDIDTKDNMLYRNICKKFNIFYIDIDKILYKKKYEQEIYSNPSHYTEEYQKVIAEIILQKIDNFKPKEINFTFFNKYPINFSTLSSSDCNVNFENCTRAVYSTNLLTTNVYLLDKDSKISVETKNTLLACIFYASESNGYIFFYSKDNILRKNLRLKWKKGLFCRSVGYLFPQIKSFYIKTISNKNYYDEPTHNSIIAPETNTLTSFRDFIFADVSPSTYLYNFINYII